VRNELSAVPSEYWTHEQHWNWLYTYRSLLDEKNASYPAWMRTSAAERDEAKGFLVIDTEGDRPTGGRVTDWEFRRLPARPMIDLEIGASTPADPKAWLTSSFEAMDGDAVIRVRVTAEPDEAMREALRAATLRELALPTQTVEVSWPRRTRGNT
jgi:hypothetical protein